MAWFPGMKEWQLLAPEASIGREVEDVPGLEDEAGKEEPPPPARKDTKASSNEMPGGKAGAGGTVTWATGT